MPELPEIEVTRRVLAERLRGRHVEDVWLKKEGKTVMPGAERLPELRGKRLSDVERRGKMLVLDFEQELALVIHLMLIGRVALFPGGQPVPVEPRLKVKFKEGEELEVRFVAARSLALLDRDDLDKHPTIARQGPDALDLTRNQFEAALGKVRGSIKDVFMQQELIAGVGNAYADEILFDAKLHPMTPVALVTGGERDRLYEQVAPVLRRAIELGAAEEYLEDLGPVEGISAKADLMRVHNRRGRPCPECGKRVQLKLLKGRNTFFCPECQKLPE